MYLTNFDYQIGFKNIFDRYFKERDIDVCDKSFDFEKSIKDLVNIDNRWIQTW